MDISACYEEHNAELPSMAWCSIHKARPAKSHDEDNGVEKNEVEHKEEALSSVAFCRILHVRKNIAISITEG